MTLRMFKNADHYRRVFPGLVDPATGHTVDLEPGAQVELDLPSDFSHPHLVSVAVKKPKKTEEPAPSVDDGANETVIEEAK